MISIIIIGKNEGWKIHSCIKSIYNMINIHKDIEFEIFYIDSNSTDNSINIVKKFKNIHIYKIIQNENSAFARNLGALKSKGDILFFIDGDMEVHQFFLKHALFNNKLKYDCLTGHLDDFFYTNNGIFIAKKPRTYFKNIPTKEAVLKTNGGIFLIKREHWFKIAGMRTKYKRSQDIDFTLRLNEIGITTIRIPYLIAKHNTVSYNDTKRMWKILAYGNFLYPALIFRDHIKKIYIWKKTLRAQYTAFFLIFFTILSALFHSSIFFLYPLITLLRIFLITKKEPKSTKIAYFVLNKFFNQIFSDICFWIGLLFFYPKNSTSKYIKIQ